MDGIAFQDTRRVAWKTIEEYLNALPAFAGASPITDYTAALTSALAAPSSGGVVTVPPGNFSISSSITIPAGVILRGSGKSATTFTWAGVSGAAMFILASDYSAIEDLTVDTGSATTMTGILFRDNLRCWLDRVNVVSATIASGIGVRFQGGDGGSGTAHNCAFHNLYDIEVTKFQTAFQFDGIASGPTVATDIKLFDCRVQESPLSYRFAQWCDTLTIFGPFSNMTSNNSIFAVFNDSVTPAVEVGVYNIKIYDADFDSFGGLSGCTGLFFNVCKQIYVDGFFHSPETFPGTLVDDNAGRAISYVILNTQVDGANNEIQMLKKGVRRGSVQASDASGTSYGLGPTDVTFDTVTYDPSGCFSASKTFTAPNTGKYAASVTLTHTAGVTLADRWLFKLVTSGRTYATLYYVPVAAILSFNWAVNSIDLNAGDTLKLTVERSAGAGNFILRNDKDFNKLCVEQVDGI